MRQRRVRHRPVRVARRLLSRVEDETTGQIELGRPLRRRSWPDRSQQAKDAAARILGDEVLGQAAPSRRACSRWRSDHRRASILEPGPGGRSSPSPRWTDIRCRTMAATCLLLHTALKWSLRLPPTCDAEPARLAVKKALRRKSALWRGWRYLLRQAGLRPAGTRPRPSPWLAKALDKASQRHLRQAGRRLWAKAAPSPSWAMLPGRKFPETQSVRDGRARDRIRNAHGGPNEFSAHPHRQGGRGVDRLHRWPITRRCNRDELSGIPLPTIPSVRRGGRLLLFTSWGPWSVGAGASVFTEPAHDRPGMPAWRYPVLLRRPTGCVRRRSGPHLYARYGAGRLAGLARRRDQGASRWPPMRLAAHFQLRLERDLLRGPPDPVVAFVGSLRRCSPLHPGAATILSLAARPAGGTGCSCPTWPGTGFAAVLNHAFWLP